MKFYIGRLRPKVQTLHLKYTDFYQNGTPFICLKQNCTPFLYIKVKPKQQKKTTEKSLKNVRMSDLMYNGKLRQIVQSHKLWLLLLANEAKEIRFLRQRTHCMSPSLPSSQRLKSVKRRSLCCLYDSCASFLQMMTYMYEICSCDVM